MCNATNCTHKPTDNILKESMAVFEETETGMPFNVDVEAEIDKLTKNLDDLGLMRSVQDKMRKRDFDFAEDLYNNFINRGALSDKQWHWVRTLTERVVGLEPIYGSFDPILVMFRLATSNRQDYKPLKKPKIRLMSKEGVFVQLNFNPNEDGGKKMTVYIDGWQGHGYRKFAGWIESDKIIPYRRDRMTDDVKNIIQDLSLDPVGTAKAMSKLLGVCVYCGSRLTVDRSKEVGYGPYCAGRYGLPY